MTAVTVMVPDEALDALDIGPEEMVEELRVAGAMKLYELGRLSSGAAAALAGIPRVLFLSRLADYGIDTFRQTGEDLEEEVATAREWAHSHR